MPTLASDPRDLLLDANSDIVIDSDASFARGLSGITQDCRTACKLAAEEWFLNLDVGVDYLNILRQRPAIGIINARTSFTRELLAVQDVLRVAQLDLEYDSDTRTLLVTFSVTTSLGDTEPDTLTFTRPA